ncbi:hypothetical protein ARMSODRAFT_605595 [Armillaria solidipes]|uniref:Uncharacterized protein n=1 Tax=Armillaria solidipes TaxID=1076256 RepID=A0A2H3AUP3_9AGAR|nr:hypothetical protein ARMSODRAFT_605595 [Armillaria solidipes]
MNTHLLASIMDSPRDMEDWEVPVSEIRDYTYTLVSTTVFSKRSPLIATLQIDLFGFEDVTAFRDKAMETPMNERDAMMLAYEGEVLVSGSNSITELESSLGTEQSCSGHRTCYSLEEPNICRAEPRTTGASFRL